MTKIKQKNDSLTQSIQKVDLMAFFVTSSPDRGFVLNHK